MFFLMKSLQPCCKILAGKCLTRLRRVLKMPIDINMFRVDRGGDPEVIRESQRRRYASVEIVDEIIAKDDEWRQCTGGIDNLKKERNAVQKQIALKKKAKEECDDMVKQTKEIGEQIAREEARQESLRAEIARMVGTIGNLVDLTVPVSQDEDADNEVLNTWGNCRDPAGLLNHHDLLWRIGGYEPERGVGVAGHRGYFLRDVGVMLNQAFINYGIAFLRNRGYCVLQPPYMMKKSVMAGVAQLEQFDEELYKVSGDGEDKYLIATSEQPICGYHQNDWLEEKALPIRYAGVSTCFRKEAGSHGKDTWGIFRVHQFEKVEQFVVVEGDLEKSRAMQEEMSKCAEEFYQSLGFPYRVINIVTGALNNAAIRKFDIECWFPGYNAYRELVSCSNCTDYQSRAMEIRCGIKKLGDREKKYVHMLNSTLCATGRAICCLLENYQEADGVRIPDVLVPFMGGMTFMPFVRDSKGAPTVPAIPKAAPSSAKPGVAVKPAKAEATKPAASGPEAELVAAIGAKGDEVRDLKASKADKAAVKAKVDELLALKAQYQELTGNAFGAPSTAKPAAAAKPAKATATKPKDESKKPKGDSKKPADVVKAAAPPRASAKSPAASATASVWMGDKVDTALLEAKLKVFSYVGGYEPSAEDNRVLRALTGLSSDSDLAAWVLRQPLADFVQITRWLRNVTSFPSDERATW